MNTKFCFTFSSEVWSLHYHTRSGKYITLSDHDTLPVWNVIANILIDKPVFDHQVPTILSDVKDTFVSAYMTNTQNGAGDYYKVTIAPNVPQTQCRETRINPIYQPAVERIHSLREELHDKLRTFRAQMQEEYPELSFNLECVIDQKLPDEYLTKTIWYKIGEISVICHEQSKFYQSMLNLSQ